MMKRNGQVQVMQAEQDRIENELMERVQAFINQKDRVKHYHVKGDRLTDSDAFFDYTDEEVIRVKKLLSEAFARYLNLPYREYTIDEIKARVCLDELKGQIGELDELLFDFLDDFHAMNLVDIDLDHPVYFYTMSCHVFNVSKKKVEGPILFKVRLTDEEYRYLLFNQLKYRTDFTFNSLFVKNPELALKINEEAEKSYLHFLFLHRMPFLVTMDEVVGDAYQLEGPAPFHKRLYDDYTETVETHHVLYVRGRRVCMLKEVINKVDHSIMCYTLKDVSADELVASLEVFDYEVMAKKISERFRGKEGYEQFQTFLDNRKIAYVVDDYQKN